MRVPVGTVAAVAFACSLMPPGQTAGAANANVTGLLRTPLSCIVIPSPAPGSAILTFIYQARIQNTTGAPIARNTKVTYTVQNNTRTFQLGSTLETSGIIFAAAPQNGDHSCTAWIPGSNVLKTVPSATMSN